MSVFTLPSPYSERELDGLGRLVFAAQCGGKLHFDQVYCNALAHAFKALNADYCAALMKSYGTSEPDFDLILCDMYAKIASSQTRPMIRIRKAAQIQLDVVNSGTKYLLSIEDVVRLMEQQEGLGQSDIIEMQPVDVA